MVSIAKVLLGAFGVALVVTLIAVPTAIFLNDDSSESVRTFSLGDVFNSSLKPSYYNMRWISDEQYLHRTQDTVFLHNVKTGESSEFLSKTAFEKVEAYDYQLSADHRYVAFMSNYTKLWRHSFTASYWIYHRENTSYSTPTHNVQFFSWAPEGNKLAFVMENNVYLKTSPDAAQQQVTFNGKENQILNGIPDWVYEEEMFSSNQALWWSPGGKNVAYAQFNEQNVHTIEYTWYGEGQYPSTVVIPYPKPGTTNPVAKLFVVDAANITRITEVVVPASIASGDHYLASVTWVTDERIAVEWLKRKQNHLILQIYDFDGTSWNPGEARYFKWRWVWAGYKPQNSKCPKVVPASQRLEEHLCRLRTF